MYPRLTLNQLCGQRWLDTHTLLNSEPRLQGLWDVMSPHPAQDYSFSMVSHQECITDPLLDCLPIDKISKWGNVSFKNKWHSRGTGIQQIIVLHFSSLPNSCLIQQYVLACGSDLVFLGVLFSRYSIVVFQVTLLVTIVTLWHRYLGIRLVLWRGNLRLER